MAKPRAEAARWLAAAREDLKAAEYLTEGHHYAPACFHAQQAAEKAVKAVHYSRGARAVLGHSVRQLIEQLDPRPAALSKQLDGARELDVLYLPTRYPNGLAAGSPGDAFSNRQATRATTVAAEIIAAAENATTAA